MVIFHSYVSSPEGICSEEKKSPMSDVCVMENLQNDPAAFVNFAAECPSQAGGISWVLPQ